MLIGVLLPICVAAPLIAGRPPTSEVLFADSFESGTAAAWSHAVGMPTVTVHLDLPEALRATELALEVARLPEREVLWRLETESGASSQRISGLPTAPLEILLEAPPWRFRQPVDLSSGDDQRVVFAPKPTWLRGTVYRGEEPHEAMLRLQVDLEGGGELLVPTSTSGRFETALFHPGIYTAVVELTGSTGPPHLEVLHIPDAATFEHDFRIAAITFRVHVVDREDGDAITAASVVFKNRCADGRIVQETVTTDAEGWAKFTQVLPGTVEYFVVAEEYQIEQSAEMMVAIRGGPYEVEVGLEATN